MCFHLSIVVSAKAVAQLHSLLPPCAPAHPELDPDVLASMATGGECFSLGVQCACDLYRKGPTASDRLRKRAARDHWSQAKLQRAIKYVGDDWTGLHPQVRETLAAIAESSGPVSVFLFWTGGGGRSDVRGEREIDPDTFRSDPLVVAENRKLLVKASGSFTE